MLIAQRQNEETVVVTTFSWALAICSVRSSEDDDETEILVLELCTPGT